MFLQAKQRASIKWLLSKAFNNRVPENLLEPFYRDHEVDYAFFFVYKILELVMFIDFFFLGPRAFETSYYRHISKC